MGHASAWHVVQVIIKVNSRTFCAVKRMYGKPNPFVLTAIYFTVIHTLDWNPTPSFNQWLSIVSVVMSRVPTKTVLIILFKSLLRGWIKVLPTSAIRHKADQDKGIIHITQDVVRAIWVLPGCSCTMSFAIQVMSNVTVCKNTFRWILLMFLAVSTSHLIASFVRGLTVQLATAQARLHAPVCHTYSSYNSDCS